MIIQKPSPSLSASRRRSPAMRRIVFLSVGVLEFLVATLLVTLGCQLPGRGDVEQSFGRLERVTRRAGSQVQRLRHQPHELRRPELQQLAARLRDQTREVTALLREQSVDFNTVATLRDALGVVGEGLDGLAKTLDPRGVARLG